MSKPIIRAMLFALLALSIGRPQSAREPRRPKIMGISAVQIEVSDLHSAIPFYGVATGIMYECAFCEEKQPGIFELPSGQFVYLKERKAPTNSSFLKEVRFSTSDVVQLRNYLKSENVPYREMTLSNGNLALLKVTDPEGHEIGFERAGIPANPRDFQLTKIPDSVQAKRIIHAGFVVKDRAAMDHFYKDILGFRLYWQGGMRDGETDWVDMQVPDGTDWIEYMLNVSLDVKQDTLGVMNHIALGVANIKRCDDQLLQSKLHFPINEVPQIGRDGKWQLNLYDPDGTRVELMEFTPVEKPCCSEYTGPHPKP